MRGADNDPRARHGVLTVWLFVTLAAAIAFCAPRQAHAAYGYFKSITIDRTKIGNAGAPVTFSNFPMLYSVIDPNLRTTANGGRVTSASGYDITFRASDGVTQLDHEIEKYVPTTGELVAWVRVPTLNTISAASDTGIYIYYGDAGVVTPTANATGVWDANYKAVWHLKESVGGAGAIKDSTTNAKNGTPTNGPVLGAAGKIGPATTFDGANDYITLGANAMGSFVSYTVSAWIKVPAGEIGAVISEYNGGVCSDFHFSVDNPNMTVHDGGSGTTNGVAAVDSNTWHYVSATNNGTTSIIYVDGVQDTTGGDVEWKNFCATDVRIGSTVAFSSGYIKGMIDELRVSDIPRTAHWMKAEYNNQNSPATFHTTGAEQAPGSVSGFNVVEPGANPVTGKIYTKVAGQNFTVQIVALDALNVILPLFSGSVAVEVVDNTSGGACSGLPLIATLTNQSFSLFDFGRHNLTAPNTVPNAYRNAKFRIKYPAASPTVTACSGDNFAIRPASLTFAVTDANRTTAGSTNTLNNLAIAGALVHNAGRPFRIAATAYNGAGTPIVTSNYDGTPTAVLTACAGTACTATTGTLTPGAWSASAGTVTTTTASYDDVGAFNLQLQDATFAAVDAADGSSAAQLTISSTATGVGRFVPDRFLVSATSITPRSDIAACAASTFTYMAERMNAVFTVTAVAFPSGTTTRYTGTLGRLVLTTPASFSFGAIDGTTVLGSRIDTSLGSAGAWTNGAATVTAVLSVQRTATPDGPFNSFRLGVAPTDPDGVALDPATLNLDADNSGSSERVQVGAATGVRFGRLRVQNTVGSQLIAAPIPIESQYWNGSAFVTNAADNCTSIAAANVALGNYQKNLGAGETVVTVGGLFSAGVGSLRLSAPGAANDGSVDVSINLTAAAAGASCTAGLPASTGIGKTYFQSAWCGATYDRDPTARVTFGLLRAPSKMIYRRENF